MRYAERDVLTSLKKKEKITVRLKSCATVQHYDDICSLWFLLVVGSYDDIVAAQQALDRSTNLNVDAKGLLEEVYENIKYRKRNMKRKSSSRILELWDVLMCPPSSKLAFKFQSEVR